MLSNTCRYVWMRIGVLCATFRARRLHAGQVHELLRQDDTLVCDCHANLKQLCRLSFCSDGCSSLEPNERRHHGWPHAKRLRPSVHSCDEERLRCSLLCGRVSFSILYFTRFKRVVERDRARVDATIVCESCLVRGRRSSLQPPMPVLYVQSVLERHTLSLLRRSR